jgi:DeoR/GlpR family transcriptional regulator of sugar metabolism
VAKAIAGIPGLKVLTSSLAIASVLHGHDNIDLVLSGGNARKRSPDLFGPLTEENLLQFRTNLAILGADAADRHGLYTTDAETARVSKAIVAGSEEVMLVADSGKFGRTSFVKYADWGKIHRVVTDGGIGEGERRWLKKAVSEVCYVRI